MKKRFKAIGAVVIVAVGLYGWREWSHHKLRASVEETRQQLRRDGFKTELTDFNLSPPADSRQRAEAITNSGFALRSIRGPDELQLMKPVGPQVALRVTQLQDIPPRGYPSPQSAKTGQVTPASPLFTEEPLVPRSLCEQMTWEFLNHNSELDELCRLLNGGDFQFDPVTRNGGFLLPYLADVKKVATALSARTGLAIHERRLGEAFTSLLGLTQLTTRWQPEPMELSHLIRFSCAQIAQAPLWEALQTDGWNDDPLAALQREWEAAEFFVGLPEAQALERASTAQLCRNAREDSFVAGYGGWGGALKHLASRIRNSPGNGLRDLKWFIEGYRQQAQYQNVGSYVDEKGLLLYYRDRELETQRALACRTWLEMRAIPGVTNVVSYQSTQPSRMGSMISLRAMTLAHTAEGRRSLARAAETEARRRLMVTAIALKRFQLRHGSSPASLGELVPDLLGSVPLDFMDGKELRYRRFEDGRFVLYSVGLDGIDNGGQMWTWEQLRAQRRTRGGYFAYGSFENTDLVWPMAANEAEESLYETSTDETLKQLNEMMFRDILMKHFPPRPKDNVSPYPRDFE
ncbi:MAG TPA: hypothetical protein VFZ59_17460 [Verrucomicrobiae bacterium]|nr:hypothetical protein [Verrucomicrobiae bacterium]